MEGVPKKKESNIEDLSDWRVIKGQSLPRAEALVGAIDGYEAMELRGQLEALMIVLKDLQEDNSNRFVAEVIAHRISFLEEMIRHDARLNQLGIAV